MNRQITNLSITILKVHPRNQEFFDDIEGGTYEQFRKSIGEDGIITPLIVSPDMTIISGHQRYKACIDLGIDLIPVIIQEDLISEEEKLKKLLASNFGRLKNDENKQRKVAVEYVELCGLKLGDNQWVSDNRKPNLTQQQIADGLGVSVTTLNEMLAIERKLTPEMKELINDGSITKTTASKILTKLSQQEQYELIKSLPASEKLTQNEVQQYINKIKELENKPSKVVDNTDYDIVNSLESQVTAKEKDIQILKRDKDILDRKLKLNEEDAKKYTDLKKQIEYLKTEQSDIARQIESATSISGLIVEVENMLRTKLAPIQYSSAIQEQSKNPIVINNVTGIIDRVEIWCSEMKKVIGQDYIVVEGE